LFILAPLIFALTATLGLMGFTGTPLSVATASFAAMAVGIGADFAIYMLFRMREDLSSGSSLRSAVSSALQSSGRAVFFVSVAVVVGYSVLALSGFRVWEYLGLLTAMMVAVAAVSALTILPSIVIWVKPRFVNPASAIGARDYVPAAPSQAEPAP